MDRSRPLTLAAAALLATTLLVACGDDDNATTTTVATSAGGTTSGSTGGTTESTGGDDEDIGSQQDYIDAATEVIQVEEYEMKGCLAEAIVSDDVYAAIKKDGMSIDDFKKASSLEQLGITQEQAAEVADSMAGCGALSSMVVSEEGKERDCLEARLSNVQIGQLLAYSAFHVDPPEDLKAATDEVDACIKGDESAPATTG